MVIIIMENKYYVPSITDLYVGYELFYIKDLIAPIESNNLVKIILKDKALGDILSTEVKIQDNRLMSVVSKYLDKEDIESLGWINGGEYYSISIKDLDVYEDYIGHQWRLFVSSDGKISIDLLRINEDTGEYCYSLYEGNSNCILSRANCPSINELKYIMKLLNIK